MVKWIYRGDDWLLVRRWEQLITARDEVDIVQIISYNGAPRRFLTLLLPSRLPDHSANRRLTPSCRLRRVALRRARQGRAAQLASVGRRLPARAMARALCILRPRVQGGRVSPDRQGPDLHVGAPAPQGRGGDGRRGAAAGSVAAGEYMHRALAGNRLLWTLTRAFAYVCADGRQVLGSRLFYGSRRGPPIDRLRRGQEAGVDRGGRVVEVVPLDGRWREYEGNDGPRWGRCG